ncbi:MAG: hypothetical protein IKD76_05310, partial [Clostridia bacterium]|nr:hypothetical protein [Clostridia bacterium]
LNITIEKKKVNYIVDADIKGYFDHIDWDWLIKCVEQHIKDPRIIRLIRRFLKAGIMEGTQYIEVTEGTQHMIGNCELYYGEPYAGNPHVRV